MRQTRRNSIYEPPIFPHTWGILKRISVFALFFGGIAFLTWWPLPWPALYPHSFPVNKTTPPFPLWFQVLLVVQFILAVVATRWAENNPDPRFQKIFYRINMGKY